MNNQEKQDDRVESKAIEKKKKILKENKSKVFASDNNDTSMLTRSLHSSKAFPMTN
jgi:hypothetical protein